MTKGYLDLVRHDGNSQLFFAVEASIVATLAGVPLHIHAEGLRGTGKTTIMRAAREILPPIERIKGCPYNCSLEAPHCPAHRGRSREELCEIGMETIPMPFLEISHSAKVATVVGTIDLARVIGREDPEIALLPGILPRAHRGIVFIDEINRLADTSPELTDILLDVMGTKPGRLQVEEAGFLPFDIPISVSVWAASNPDEDPGALEDVRKQLADRFDLAVAMGRPREAAVVRSMMFESAALGAFDAAGRAKEALEFTRRLGQAGAAYPDCDLAEQMADILAEMYVDYGIESLRAIQSAYLGVRAAAALAGKRSAGIQELRIILPLVLRHRVPENVRESIVRMLDECPGKKGAPPGGDDPGEDGERGEGTAIGARNMELREGPVGGSRGKFLSFWDAFLANFLAKVKGRSQEEPHKPVAPRRDAGTVEAAAPPRPARRISTLPPNAIVACEEDLCK